ncbi:SNF2 family N-terminal domain-containing protein [Delphinella strobiligena]|nr:SNF2 family N-terminal domain-containing protein [Delphinella strobiligena]
MMQLEKASATDTTPAPGNPSTSTPPEHHHQASATEQQEQIDSPRQNRHVNGNHDSTTQRNGQPSTSPSASERAESEKAATAAAVANNKKRKLADLQTESRSRSASKPPSPPWKKFGADGPTAFLDNGKRRSGRVNTIPIDLQPPSDKRKTRSAQPPSQPQSTPQSTPARSHKKASVPGPQNGTPTQPVTSSTRRESSRQAAANKSTINGTTPKSTPKPTPKPTPQKSASKINGVKQDKSPKSTKKKEEGPNADDVAMEDAPPSSPVRKTSSRLRKTAHDEIKQESKSKADTSASTTPRITLKLRRTETTYNPQHPSHIPNLPPYPTIEESLAAIDAKEKEQEKAAKFDENYEGLERLRPAADRERLPDPTPLELAEKEALIRLRILDAAEPGGPLSEEKSSLYLPDEQPEPPKQYSHLDYVWTQGAYFRLLLDREKRTHVEQAKKVAYAALAKWKEKQPQTEEEKEREERTFFQTIYRQTVKDMGRKWELVGDEVNRRRHAEWQIEENKRREKRMQEVMERSTNLLDARKAARDGREESLLSADSLDVNDYDDTETPASATDGQDDSQDGEDSDVMSDTDSDSDDEANVDDPDANLSPEALRRKYASLPDLPPADDSDDSYEDEDVGTEDVEDEEGDTTQIAQANDAFPVDETIPAQDTDAEQTPAEPEIDYANVQLEEVDDALLDDSDESINMSDEDMSDEEDDDGEEEDSEEDDEEDVGLLGFLGGSERKAVQDSEEPADEHVEGDATTAGEPDEMMIDQPVAVTVDEVQDKQLVPPSSDQIDAAHHLSVEGAADRELAEPTDITMEHAVAEPLASESTPDRNMLSVDSHGEDRSSQISVKDDTTVEPTEAESTTSIDLEDAEKITESTDEQTPQPTNSPRTKVPSLLRGTLREYQHEGLDWLAKLYANKTNGILADEMGLGKTIQTIALLAHLAEEHQIWGPHLIVVPTSVILNWEVEFKKFLPGFKVLSYYGSVEERLTKRKGWSNPDNYNVVITSYQLVLKDIMSIKVPDWHYMILDEAHNIKNFNSQRYRAMIRLKTHARLLLTGTPLQNNIQELWSLLTFLTAGHDGQGMGELHEFEEWFSKPVNEIFTDSRQELSGEAQKIVNKLHHSLRPYLLRRLKAHVEKQLPGKYEHTVICRLSKRQRQLYDAFMGLSDTKAKLLSGNMVSVSMALMALKKVCNHPDLFEERPIVTSFAMPKPYSKMPRAAIADYEIKNLLIRKKLLAEDPSSKLDLNFLSLNLTSREGQSGYHVRRSRSLRASAMLNEIARRETLSLPKDTLFDGSSLGSILAYQNRHASAERLDKIRKYAFLTKHRTDFVPVYGTDLVEAATIRSATDRLSRQPPRERALQSEWYQSTSELLHRAAKTLPERAEEMQPYVSKFGCITPNVVAENLLAFTTPASTINAIRAAAQADLTPNKSLITTLSSTTPPRTPASDIIVDPFHEARTRLSIAFPDKRLLQFDCGKLQRLAPLLRSLQSKGSRALIFTQMTSVLNILESFLNIHGYRYLRLDGSTRIEQRQDMMERFNRDTRIDVFILSSRSGGVGMNLTGADTVIFYDLDWNPQMDRQCQDRAHRIGQMRDVHIYKFVSESTIEVNILKKSNQKRLLDEVVIQEGEFTTDWFNRPDPSLPATVVEDAEGDDVAGAAVDKFFGQANAGQKGGLDKVLESVEDADDVAAAREQQKELQATGQDFETDFDEKAGTHASGTPRGSVPPTPGVAPGHDVTTGDVDLSRTLEAAEVGVHMQEQEKDEVVVKADGKEEEVKHVDEYMLRTVHDFLLKGIVYVPPIDRKRARLDRNGRDRSHRAKRIR